MYRTFFGLNYAPFNMAPDARVLFKTEQHLESLAGLTYTILNRKGLAVLTGDAGTGKTTLLTRTLQTVAEHGVRSSMIFHPTLSIDDFLELVLLDFGISEVPASKAQRLTCLQQFLLSGHEQGKISVLIVDEAHKLSTALLEEIRLLGNFDHGGEKLLQILLIGQSELSDMLNRHDLRQLKQRVAVRLTVAALSYPQVEQYLRYRWRQAGGGDRLPFADGVVDEIAAVTKGNPRSINAVCDSALLQAFAEGSGTVNAGHIREAARDLQLTPARPASPTFAPANGSAGNGQLSAPLPAAREAIEHLDHVDDADGVTSMSGPIRVPDFCTLRPPLIARWAIRLRLVHAKGSV